MALVAARNRAWAGRRSALSKKGHESAAQVYAQIKRWQAHHLKMRVLVKGALC